MTENVQAEVQKNANDTDTNLVKIRKMFDEERAARIQAEQRINEYEKAAQQRQSQQQYEDDDDSEPYVDQKKLQKKLAQFEKSIEEKIQKKSEENARIILNQEKQQSWLKSNPDFYEIMQHAETFANKDPELAETILQMPDTFERQKLVYKTIKAMGIHKKPEPERSIQQKIDANKRSPYYQPSGVATAPYSNEADYSQAGQKNAYQKMQELKSRLGLR